MKSFESAEDILNFAIQREAEAYSFYKQLSDRTDRPEMAKLFNTFAAEEMGHKKKLQGIRDGQTLAPTIADIRSLQLADYLTDVEPSPDMNMQDALIVAIKKEQKAHELYTDLSAAAPTAELKALFEMLATEEAKHRLQFETWYDDQCLREN